MEDKGRQVNRYSVGSVVQACTIKADKFKERVESIKKKAQPIGIHTGAMGRGRSSSPAPRERADRRGGPHESPPPGPPRPYNGERYSPSWGDGEDKGKERARADYRPSGVLRANRPQREDTPLKYDEPPDAARPVRRWRLHVFKGDTQVRVIHLGERSCYRFGRDPAVPASCCPSLSAHPRARTRLRPLMC